MINSNDILKYINGTLSDLERDRVKLWLDSSSENMEQYEFLKLVSENSSNLTDIRLFDVEESWNELNAILDNDSTNVVPLRKRFVRIISVAASLLIVGFALNYFFNREPLYNEIITQNSLDTITLIDGSIVYLEKNAKLKYFTRKDEKSKKRYVELTGNARFEIKHNENLPFVVFVNGAGIDVLGTVFKIDYLSEGVKVENVNGVVKLFEWENASNSMILNEGEVGEYKGGLISKVDPIVEPVKEMIGQYHEVEEIIEMFFDKYDARMSTSPYADILMQDKVFVDFNQPLESIILQLDTTAKLKYRKTCKNCYEISILKSK